jgi:hypothetical protein
MNKLTVGASAAVVAAAVAALPGVASAHHAVVTCSNGQYVVTPDYLQLKPTWVIANGSVTVTWTDGYKITLTLPEGCVAPTPPPVPPVPEVVPPPVVIPPTPTPPAPPTCAELKARYPKAGPVRLERWGCPANPVKKPTRKITKRYYQCTGFGPAHRARVVITVTVGNKVGKVTRYTKVCKPPAVTG